MAMAVLVVLGVIAYRTTTGLVETADRVARGHKLVADLQSVLSELQDAETGERGYILTGEERYLQPYNAAVRNVSERIAELRESAEDDPHVQEKLQLLEPLIVRRFSEFAETIELRKTKGFAAALQVVQTDRGRKIMEKIREMIHEMADEESALLILWDREAKASARNATRIISA